jgi:hypothetical protein
MTRRPLPLPFPFTRAYSAEVDRLFRANVTGHSAEFVVEGFSTLVGHDQSRFHRLSGFVTRARRLGFGLRFGRRTLAHRFLGLEMDSMRAVNDAVEDRVGKRRIADVVVPVAHG